jgi:catalase
MTEDKKQLLIENTARNIGPATDNIKYRHAAHCYLADKDYGARIAEALGLDFDRVKKYSKLTHDKLMEETSAAKWKG